ncbi:MAG: diguanylate cyclase [Miltoncostaeaceae bacterium]
MEGEDRRGRTTLVEGRSVVNAIGHPAVLLDGAGVVLAVNRPLCELVGRSRDEVVGTAPPHTWWTPDVSALTSAPAEIPARVIAPDGQALDVVCSSAPVGTGGGDPVWLVGVTPSAGASGPGRLTRLVSEQAALARVARVVAAGAAPDRVFDLVARESAMVLGVEAGLVMRFEGEHSEVVGSYGAHRSSVGTTFPLEGGGAAVRVFESGRPARAVYADLGDDDTTTSRVQPQGYVSGVAAPVTVDGGLWGAVLAATTSSRPLPQGAEDRLERFADLVSLGIGRMAALRELARRATTDSLTGLYNHGEFHSRLAQRFAAARSEGRPLALALFDVDHFKDINDRAGHPAGDRVLARVAAAVASVVRPGDIAGRVGGEEFGLILPEAGLSEAMAVAERVRRAVGGMDLDDLPGITLSGGVADLVGVRTAAALYRAADAALYDAKRRGRNRICGTHPVAA